MAGGPAVPPRAPHVEAAVSAVVQSRPAPSSPASRVIQPPLPVTAPAGRRDARTLPPGLAKPAPIVPGTAQQRPFAGALPVPPHKPRFPSPPSPQVQRKPVPHSRVSRLSGVVQRLGENLVWADEEDRFFESANKGYRLRVNPDMDPFLEEHFNRAARLKKAAVSLGEKIAHIVDHVYRTYKYNKELRDRAILDFPKQDVDGGSEVGARSLGSLLDVKAVACWEKASFLHVLLAELGISSQVVGGTRDGGAHAWVKVDLGSVVIDPTWRKIEPKNFHSRYKVANEKRVVSPRSRVDDGVLREALTEARKIMTEDAFSFEQGWEQKRMALKVERAEREEESQRMFAPLNDLIRQLNPSLPVTVLPPGQNPMLRQGETPWQKGGVFEL